MVPPPPLSSLPSDAQSPARIRAELSLTEGSPHACSSLQKTSLATCDKRAAVSL